MEVYENPNGQKLSRGRNLICKCKLKDEKVLHSALKSSKYTSGSQNKWNIYKLEIFTLRKVAICPNTGLKDEIPAPDEIRWKHKPLFEILSTPVLLLRHK